jgi:hypothetical protein
MRSIIRLVIERIPQFKELKMKKTAFFGFVFLAAASFSVSLYAQHAVNDISEFGGWYKVKIEILQSGNVLYYITQCYPSGDEYEVTGNEREKLPLYLKAMCMGMVDEGMKDSFNFNEMTFSEEGFFMQLTSFSFEFVFDFSNMSAENINKLESEMGNTYRHRKWQ